MDRIENYRRILELTVKRHAQFQPANGEIKTHPVCDRETDEYMVVDSGWNEKVGAFTMSFCIFACAGGASRSSATTPTRKSPANLLRRALKRATSFWLTTPCHIKD